VSAAADSSTKKPTWCLTSEADLAYRVSTAFPFSENKNFQKIWEKPFDFPSEVPQGTSLGSLKKKGA
jgi:hypothetical protein